MVKNKNTAGVTIQNIWKNESNTCAALFRRSAELQVFQEKLKAKLPPLLRDHFILANVDKTTLTIHTDSPAWAARLRFQTPDILAHTRVICSPCSPKTIRIKVVLPENKPERERVKVNLSPKNAQLIRETAESITDPVLRNALIRLSRHKS